MRNRLLLALAAAALALPGALAAQNNAQITATANVLTPITVTAGNDLDFGDVFPGLNKSIAPADATGPGSWGVTGNTSSQVILSFGVLPTNLVSGGNNLPISFGAASAAHDDGTTFTTFDPGAGATTTLSDTGTLDVYVGGTVAPPVGQPAGTYTGTITLTVNYTGS